MGFAARSQAVSTKQQGHVGILKTDMHYGVNFCNLLYTSLDKWSVILQVQIHTFEGGYDCEDNGSENYIMNTGQ